MAGIVDSFIWLSGQYAWFPFALCSMVFFLGTVTVIWHIVATHSRRYCWWLVAAGCLLGLGFALGGMQAGDNPVVPRQILIPWVRVIWLAGGIAGLIFLCLYWAQRIQIVQRRETYG